MEESSFDFLMKRMQKGILVLVCIFGLTNIGSGWSGHSSGVGEYQQPLSQISIRKTVLALHASASIQASPVLLGLQVKR